jgi:F0F1-type ATP synthase beta subunit
MGIYITDDEIHSDLFESKEDRLNQNKIKINIKAIHNIPPLNKGTKIGLAKDCKIIN